MLIDTGKDVSVKVIRENGCVVGANWVTECHSKKTGFPTKITVNVKGYEEELFLKVCGISDAKRRERLEYHISKTNTFFDMLDIIAKIEKGFLEGDYLAVTV